MQVGRALDAEWLSSERCQSKYAPEPIDTLERFPKRPGPGGCSLKAEHKSGPH